MLSKEEIEEDNTFKMSIPLITNAELNAIDNNLDDFVNQITKQVIHDKDLLVAQHIIKKQKEYIDQLETDKQKLIKKLEEVCEKVDDEMADFEAIDLKHKILEVLKGEKE